MPARKQVFLLITKPTKQIGKIKACKGGYKMSIAVIGGVKGSEKDYKTIIEKYGFKYKVFNEKVVDFNKKIKNADAIILFTGTVSHNLAIASMKMCRKNNIIIKKSHNSSLIKLEGIIKELKQEIVHPN